MNGPKDNEYSELNPEQQNARLRGRRLIARIATWIVIVTLCLIAYVIFVPPPMEPSFRSPVSRVRSDQRTLATALEAYFIDNNAYPAWTIGALGANADAAPGTPHAAMPTFRVKQGPDDPLETLTTPVSYVTAYFRDSFGNKAKGPTFAYWVPQVEDKNGDLVNGFGWILWSPGPDNDFDITDPAAVYKGYDEAAPSTALIQLSYDPSNGTQSSGDVYRLKQ